MAGRDQDVLSDQAYDEAIPVETDDEVSTPDDSGAESDPGSPSHGGGGKKAPLQPKPGRQKESPQKGPGRGPPRGPNDESDSEEGDSSSDDDSTSESGSEAGGQPRAYQADLGNLDVSQEVQELFDLIARYKPHDIELDAPFKPFVPDYVPSIGEVDAMLKMPRPDDKDTMGLGTACLDEPTLNASDPAILDLQLRSLTKSKDLEPVEVRSIESAEKNRKDIANWVKRIDELNRTKPAPTLNYSKRMPDIEQLMQVWPAEFEEYLQQNPLDEMAELDLDLPEYIRVIAAVLDIPVHGQLTETLHVMFTLYSEFKLNQHFSKTDGGAFGGGHDPYSFPGVTTQAVATSLLQSMAPSRVPSPGGMN